MSEPLETVWTALFDLAERLGALPWTLVGGQMVLLHGLQRGTTPPRVSTDLDVAVDVRVAQGGLRRIVQVLTDLGFEPRLSPGGLTHRYAKPGTAHSGVVAFDIATGGQHEQDRSEIAVDVLAPDGLGAHADVTTTPPGRAFEAAGATQALQRTVRVNVSAGTRNASIPTPNLLGALVIKAAAAVEDKEDPARHLSDLRFLLSLVDDPVALCGETGPKDRARLRKARVRLREGGGRAWADDVTAQAALDLLIGEAQAR